MRCPNGFLTACSDNVEVMFAHRTGGLRALLLAVVSVCVAAVVGSGPVAAVPSNVAETTHLGTVGNANWYGAYIPVAGGVKLYADVLVPRNRAGRVPTVLAIGPYFQHLRPQPGGIGVQEPPKRYDDLLRGARLLERGYAVVFADLRGYGASGGCPDNSGELDRSDLRAAVRWTATQRWSSGKVGMYGKSYDGITGLMAAGERIPGLAAVVAQEPVYDWYRYLYGNGVPRTTRIGTPLSLVYTSVNPPSYVNPRQFQDYATRSAANLINPACVPATLTAQQSPLPNDPYWRGRGIMEPLKRSRVPIFLTQGFIDQNTAADGLTELLRATKGPVTGWLGMWDHVRGNDTDRTALMGGLTDRPSTGRGDYLEQVGRFYDHYLKGKGTAPSGFLVQDNTGSWRAQSTWPDQASIRTVPLRPGTYRYTGLEVATKVKAKGKWLATQIDGVAAAANVVQRTADSRANGVWTVLPPEPSPIRISGTPRITVTARAHHTDPNPLVQNTPIAVDLYDVAPSGRATLITQNVSMLERGETRIRLYATDWLVRAGHRLVVRLTDTNRGRWDYPSPTSNAVVNVLSGEAQIPLAPVNAGTPTNGLSNTSLEGYLARYVYPVPLG